MAGSCLLSCFFPCSAVLLLGLCLHDVEAGSCQRAVDKKVGDDVELSSCLSPEGVSLARWKYGEQFIADKDRDAPEKEFKGRLYLNPTNFSLTVRTLTLKDSGDFIFISATNDKQREVITITLQVHEPITEQPVLTGSSTWHTSTNSCTVLLTCNATSDGSVTYKWTVRNQTTSGPGLQYSVEAQDGDTEFTCTIYNPVSEQSATKTVKCINKTQEINSEKIEPELVILLSSAVGGCLVLAIVVGIVVCVCCCKKSRAGSDSNDLTVYADISEVALENGNLSAMKPSSLYDTIDNRVASVKPGPQTVYDKIQLSRVRKASVSPYQDI